VEIEGRRGDSTMKGGKEGKRRDKRTGRAFDCWKPYPGLGNWLDAHRGQADSG